jgi:D-alanyl-D-alanine carboxypeptidase
VIVEKASGRTFRKQLNTRIIKPLGLRKTTLDNTARIVGRDSHGYKVIEGADRATTNQNPSWAGAAGGMTSTAKDLATFYRALFRGKVIDREWLEQMRTTVSMGIPGEDYGLGLWHTKSLGISPIYKLPRGTVWGHSGDIPGFNTFAFSSQRGTRQLVVFLNEDTESRTREGSTALTKVVEAVYGG